MQATERRKDSAQTKRRILDAAIIEFSARGFAGARMDRISEAAECNKAMVYRYFTSKERLFDEVFDEIVVQTIDAVPLDTDDLPGYAARLHEQHVRAPDILRIGTWDSLERDGAGMRLPAVVEATREKIRKIAAAQTAGTVTSRYAADVILEIVISLSQPPVGVTAGVSDEDRSRYIADAVRAALTT